MFSMAKKMTLVCWQCGKKLPIEVGEFPRFAFEFVALSEDVGWVGSFDMENHRSLVFCSDACCNKAKKKDGTFRVYPQREKA